jgi:hypothetical protein
MLQVKRQIYFERFQKHTEDLQKCLNKGDYIQAAEKVWGAFSSFINAFAYSEVKSIIDKKKEFKTLFNKLSSKRDYLTSILKKNFRNVDHFTSIAEGLHKFFYGGRRYPENYLKYVIPNCAELLKEIKKALIF